MNLRQRQRWSLMTVLYLIIRYMGIPFSVYVSRPITLHLFCVCLICTVFHFSDRRDTGTMPSLSLSLTDAVSILQPFHSHPINTLICR
ncbi:uncharacterized protein HD556DRAFT_1348935, partial [Suillus plorans]